MRKSRWILVSFGLHTVAAIGVIVTACVLSVRVDGHLPWIGLLAGIPGAALMVYVKRKADGPDEGT